MIVELDGGQRFASVDDKIRDAWFREEGFIVLRFWNNKVLENIDGVISEILKNCQQSPLLNPPPQGEEGKQK